MINDDHKLVWLGIFAHPDDETSASAGTMVRWIEEGGKVYIVGNGGSSSIASHVSVDIAKVPFIKTNTFNTNTNNFILIN